MVKQFSVFVFILFVLASAASGDSLVSQLRELTLKKNSGKISAEEFEKERKKIFSSVSIGEKETIKEEASSISSSKFFSGTVMAKSGLSLRSAPNRTSQKIATIPYGQIVKVLGETGSNETIENVESKWLKISFNGQEGFVFGGFVKSENEVVQDSKPVSVTPSSSSTSSSSPSAGYNYNLSNSTDVERSRSDYQSLDSNQKKAFERDFLIQGLQQVYPGMSREEADRRIRESGHDPFQR